MLSIHLTSNRPDKFLDFLNRLESVTADMSAVEVVVKIDDSDAAMNRLLEYEVARRPFRITYISTPKPKSFFELWRSFNELLELCDPHAYFIVNLNDEMWFKTKGWDKKLREYVGLFPDDIFRLRTSHHRLRTYFDFWEVGWSNDTSAIMTKRWIDLGGNWCPCNGPDTFQQFVAYYFGWLHRFELDRPYREIPIYDIDLGGAGASAGMTSDELRRRIRGSIPPWFTLVSHKMQQEAARRAQKLHANIWLHARDSEKLAIRDNVDHRQIEIINGDHVIVKRLSYKLSWLRITFLNSIRKLNWAYYGGAGDVLRGKPVSNFIQYLCLRHEPFDRLIGLISRCLLGILELVRQCPKGRVVLLILAFPFRFMYCIVGLELYRPTVILRNLRRPRRAWALLKRHTLF